jgi:hypothetical protein
MAAGVSQRRVRGFRLVIPVKEQSAPLGTFGFPTNPRTLVGKAPGLNRRATRVRQAGRRNRALDVRLAGKVRRTRVAGSVEGNGDVHLADVHL